ncbi:MAG: HD domain-containing protein [Syntrophales bacterium]|nr:HD domain-containing protein [Syntrophales bacterium]
MTVDTIDKIPVSGEAAAGIVRQLQRAGHEAYLVGGCVRDLLRGIEPVDYDIVTSARPDEVQALFPHTVPVGVSFGVVLVIEGGRSYEVATFRTEDGHEDGRRPSQVKFATAKEDVYRRDFTVNGLLLEIETGRIIDYVGGCQDIERRLIRTIGEPEERFSEDYLRVLRAVRFAANLGFEIDQQTLDAVKRHVPAIRRISAERTREELTRLLTGGGARRGMKLLAATGLLAVLLPEVEAMRGVVQPPTFHPEGDVWEHTLRMLDLLPGGAGKEADACLAWGVVMHDIGKPCTRSEDESGVHFYGHVRRGEEIAGAILQRLRFSRADMETIIDLVHCHMLFIHIKEMRPNKLKRLLRKPRFDLHLELHRLDCLGSHGFLDNYKFCKTKLAELATEELHPPRLITGHDLIAMGFRPGPIFSEILKAVEDAQLDGEILTGDEARRLVMTRWGRESSFPNP